MHPDALQRLLSLNRDFYQSFAYDFAQSRQRIQPGVQRAAKRFPPHAAVLDLGCGHGQLAVYLQRTGFGGRYRGVDASSALLELVAPEPQPPQYRFVQADLADPAWDSALRTPDAAGEPAAEGFDLACAFAVLHHLPGDELRRQMLATLRALLIPAGQVFLSVWDFMASPRMRGRLHDWDEIGLQADQLDPGDALLDWRRGGHGLRYVHQFSPEELGELASRSGFMVVDQYRSDGAGGRLGLYQVWQAD